MYNVCHHIVPLSDPMLHIILHLTMWIMTYNSIRYLAEFKANICKINIASYDPFQPHLIGVSVSHC